MSLPILVYGAPGAGASIIIWTIKKILHPDYPVEDPIDQYLSAHGQPLLSHWFGDLDEMTQILSKAPAREKIIHCELNPKTRAYGQNHITFVVYFEDDLDIVQATSLAKRKIPKYIDFDWEDVKSIVSKGLCSSTLPDALNIPFKQLFYGDLEILLNNIAEHLNVSNITNLPTLTAAHDKWRRGNQTILTNF